MKRSFYFLFALLFITKISSGQNLVLNPSFENYSACPIGLGQLTRANFWNSPLLTSPDLFNACNSPSQVGVPNNHAGHQSPRTGNGYAGIVTFTSVIGDYREYIQGELSSSLVAGNTYTISFWVSLADFSNFSASNIGFHLSNTEIGPNLALQTPYLPISAQLNQSTSPLNDTTSWEKVEWTYTAIGGEQYFSIGNFERDSATNSTITSFGSVPVAYYYIDDVSVQQTFTGTFDYSTDQNIKIYPNPTSSNFVLDFQVENNEAVRLTITNTIGQPVFKKQLGVLNYESIHIDTDSFLPGVYIIQLEVGKEVLSYKLIIHK